MSNTRTVMNGGSPTEVAGVLLIYSHPYAANAPTVMEHVESFHKYSKFRVWAINSECGFPKELANLHFAVIILHYSLFGSCPFRLSKKFLNYLQSSEASYKIAFFQDEHHYCSERFSLIDALAIDCIYSLLKPEYFSEVYLTYTDARCVLHTLTGYVDDNLIETARRLKKPYDERRIDVGYRARPLGFWMGKGGQEKTEIASKFIAACAGLDLTLDIRTGEKDRLYGDSWYEFVSRCKAMIGVEAGVSIFDLDNRVRPAVEKLVGEKPEITFDEVYDAVLEPWEGNIHYRTISPRVFEAAAFRVLMILFEGEYQGILTPMVHYLPLRKDFSNFHQIISWVRDRELVMRVTERAYRDLIESGEYDYRHFIAGVDEHLKNLGSLGAIDDQEAANIDALLEKDLAYRWSRFRTRSYFYREFPGKRVLRSIYRRYQRLRTPVED
jgi:hypothetical protein